MKSNLVQSENELLKIAIEELWNKVKSNTKLIESLYEKINMSSEAPCITCEVCKYKASFVTALKSHMTRKHKPKVLRDDNHEHSLSMSPVHDLRMQEQELPPLSLPPPPSHP